MSAAEALHAARVAGVEVIVNGEDLSLEANSPPSESVLTGLSRNKAETVTLLHIGDDGWSSEDWIAYYEERAGIIEFDGGLPRVEAEAMAHACCVSEWLDRNPVKSPQGQCLGCGQSEHAHDLLLPFGTETTGHVQLHHRCRKAWHVRRMDEAAAALAAMGINDRSKHP